MNVPDTPPVSQVYVEISSLPTQISSSNDVEDVHICGSCKCNFSDLDLFVEHKRAGCPAPAQKALSTTMAPPRSQSSLGFVTTNASNANDNSIPHSFGTQYLQLILNGENLNIENQSHDQQLQNTVRNTSNTEHQILRARLLGIAEEDASVENHNFSNNTELHSLVVGEQQQSNAKQREFQIDEEDVAALLANQLANEVVNSVNNTTIDSKTGLIHISEEFVPKSQNHFHLEALDLHEDTQDTVLKSQTEKCHTKERGVSKNNNSFPGTSGNVRRNYGNKNISNKNNVPVSTCSSTTGIINTSSICSTVTTIAPTSTATSVNSNDPSQVLLSENSDVIDIPKGRKKHMCIQCDFASWYMKDLIRHARKHTGERPFQCDWCHRSFSRLDKLQMHERIHTGEKRYTCRVCDYATHDSGSLRKHMRIHNDERPYKCQICPYRSRDSSQLTVHLRTHTGDNPFTCTFENCTSAFKTGSDLKRHSRIHTGEKPFSCSYCPYKCAIKSNLRVHIRLIHSEAKSIPCNSCSYVASTKREVKEHEKSHAASLKVPMKKKPPEIAKKKQKGTNKDSTHETSKLHTSRSGNSKTSTHLKPFCVKSHKCTYCDAAFVREDSWRSHIRQHKKSLRGQSSTTSPPLGAEAATKEVQTAGRTTAQRESMQRLTEQRENAQRKTAQSETAETVVLEAVGSETETLTSLEVHVPSRNKRVGEPQKADVIPRDYLILNSTEGTLKAGKYMLPDSTDGSANSPVAANSEIETSFVQYSVVDKNDKEPVPIVHQLNQEVLGGDNLQNQPILVYVQNPPVLHNNLDNDLCNAEIVASINQSAPIFVTGRCGQFLSVPLDQGGSLVEQFTSPLQQGMQYIVSAPFDGVIGGNTTYIQPLDSIDNSGNALSVVSFQVDKNSVASTRERSS